MERPASNVAVDGTSWPPCHLTGIDYSPDGSLLAVSGYHEVLVHKADGSEIVARLVGLSERIESVEAAVRDSVNRSGDPAVAVIPEGPYVVPYHDPHAAAA